MKRLYRFFLLFPLLFLAQTSHSQDCDWHKVPGVQGHPSLLELVKGDFSTTPVGQMVAVDNPATWVAMLSDSTVSDSDVVAGRANFFLAGLMSLSGKNYEDAAALFQGVGRGLNEDTDCGAQIYRIAARYLAMYPRSGDQPLFPHFNGGFYNYLQDSLFWGSKQDTAAYDVALGVMVGLVQWSEANDPIYLELLGDLLTRYRNRFKNNYFAALVYLRASQLKEGVDADAYARKALFALEAPATYEDRFNIYRFTQLRKALEEDTKSVTRNGKGYAEGPIAFFSKDQSGRLAPMLDKAWQQQLNREARALKFKDEVAIGVVKRDTTFNMYALLVIGFIIAAVIFFWVQLRRHRR